jgi:hypothetical protein
MTTDPDAEIVELLREAFDSNYELLKGESGRALSADGRRFAWHQVLLYWRKLRDVAQSVTDTEVYLTLPNQRTPDGRPFSIEGIVDIVREEGYTVMYDIKSHDADYVRQNVEAYEKQLNVYAHIWQTLRGENLKQTAVIATAFPRNVAEAMESNDEGYLAYALAQWNPLVPLGFDPSRVDETVAEFGATVDAIEDGEFAPREVEHLSVREGSFGQLFATAVCRNCDTRFSCDSYRRWALGSRSRLEDTVRRYFQDPDPDEELDTWLTANLDATPDFAELSQDF